MSLASVGGFASAVLLGATGPAAPTLTTIPTESRCALVSKIMTFQIEVHLGVFRLAPAAEGPIPPTRLLARKAAGLCLQPHTRSQRRPARLFCNGEVR